MNVVLGQQVTLLRNMSCKRRMLGKGIAVHLDGARVFNAAAALGVDVKEITSKVTSVQLCLSKVTHKGPTSHWVRKRQRLTEVRLGIGAKTHLLTLVC